MTENKKTKIGFLVFPGFPMACLTSMIEPLRAANEIVGFTAFDWAILSEQGSTVTSSARVVFQADAALSEAEGFAQLFLLSAPTSEFTDPTLSRGRLRRLDRHGTLLGAVSGGVFPLARAGLLDSAKTSVHWCYAAAFAQEFPQIAGTNEVISIDGRRITVSGAAAAFDLALHLVSDKLGQGVATEVACWFQHAIVRGQGVDQKVPTVRAESTDDMLPQIVREAVDIFASHIEDPIKVADAADIIGVSARQLERMFRKATGRSPLHYYRAMRMNAARQLVLYSNENMTDIALAVGYASATPMIQNYKEIFGIHPAADRDKINLFRVRKNAAVPTAH
ncbi:GlxA family transcriptional regulator [Roseobacter weihaiensis]|uniref:GlxA family transcriptional regulator n=1 Tax=Roseobacter weihaiensis TaxID=2763262 RepID=UPI001D0BE41B|nr:GlxA family transcriptional regulator [Roseobacter sp. H9]